MRHARLAVVEGVPADDVAVLLLDVGVVVGQVRPGSGEVDVFVAGPVDQARS